MRNFALLFAAAAVLVSASPSDAKSKRKPRARGPRPVVAFTLSGCETCAAFKRALRRNGVSLRISHIDDSPYHQYPMVSYSNGESDYGDRVFSGRVTFPSSIKIYEVD